MEVKLDSERIFTGLERKKILCSRLDNTNLGAECGKLLMAQYLRNAAC